MVLVVEEMVEEVMRRMRSWMRMMMILVSAVVAVEETVTMEVANIVRVKRGEERIIKHIKACFYNVVLQVNIKWWIAHPCSCDSTSWQCMEPKGP